MTNCSKWSGIFIVKIMIILVAMTVVTCYYYVKCVTKSVTNVICGHVVTIVTAMSNM